MRYKWILFDADNTLFDFTYSQMNALKETSEHFEIEYDENIFSIFTKLNNEIWTAYDENLISHEEIKTERFKRLFQLLGVNGIDLEKFNLLFIDKLVEHSKLIDGTEIFLKEIFGEVKMSIITNGMKEVQRPRFEKCKLKSHFEQIFISGEMGISKPNKEYFEFVHKNTENLKRSEYLVVGDNIIADVKGGKDYGFDTCWFNPNLMEDENIKFADFTIKNIHELKKIIFTK